MSLLTSRQRLGGIVVVVGEEKDKGGSEGGGWGGRFNLEILRIEVSKHCVF